MIRTSMPVATKSSGMPPSKTWKYQRSQGQVVAFMPLETKQCPPRWETKHVSVAPKDLTHHGCSIQIQVLSAAGPSDAVENRPMMNLKVKKWWSIEIIGSFWDDFRVDCYWCMRFLVSLHGIPRLHNWEMWPSDPRPKNFKHLPRPLRRVRFWKPKSADMWKRHEITGNYHFKDVIFKGSLVFLSFQQVLECFPPGLCGGTPSSARTVFSLLKVWMRWWRLRPSIPRCSWYHRWIRGIFCWICGVPPFQRDFWEHQATHSGWWHMDKWATWRNHTWFPSWHFPMFSLCFPMFWSCPLPFAKQGPRPGFQALRRSNAARDAALKAQKVALEGWRWCKSGSTVLVVGSQPMYVCIYIYSESDKNYGL